MARNVVVVESPAKAKTINKYLGSNFDVIASYGHIRDLPSKNGSVNPDDKFAMSWHVESRSEQHIRAIAQLVKNADTLYLATDPDREGEAISWHIQQVLEERGLLKNVNVQRIVFHEITKTAIQEAVKKPRAVNQELVDAYLARRALDYLVGFTLSPVLWRKLPGSRSAGRVQSVALRMIVEREQEIERFIAREYWSILGNMQTDKNVAFEARLTHYAHKKLDKFDVSNGTQAAEIKSVLEKQSWRVHEIEKKQQRRHAAAPFITSTLQQEASRKLGFGASRTMQTAQKLYEGVAIDGEVQGLITYMRTDSVTLSADAISQIRTYIGKNYASGYLPDAPRVYKSKAKNAQEAHEAIRPTNIELTPKQAARYLDEGQLKLYDLIWKRAVASQMESAVFDQVSVDILSSDKAHTMRATGSTLVFDGFLTLYREGRDDEPEDDDNRLLPVMKEGMEIQASSIDPHQHFTQPPPRFGEASLVKRLEELGIGRPSTYASLIQVLQDREYVRLERKQFHPQDRGRLVTSFLSHFFQKYVAYDFTADLEEELDEISNGKRSWTDVLNHFWKGFHKTVEDTQPLRITEVIDTLEEDLSTFLFQDKPKEERVCPKCETGHVSLKLGKFGAFLGCSDYPTCTYTKQLGQNAEAAEGGATLFEPRELGNDEGVPVTVRRGPYGYYLQWDNPNLGKKEKPKRVGLLPNMDPFEIDMATAMKLKSLPYTIAESEEYGKLQVGLGRFGPYVKFKDGFASIPKDVDPLSITREEVEALVLKKINNPSKRTKAAPPAKKAAPVKKAVAVKKTPAKKAPAKKTAVKKKSV